MAQRLEVKADEEGNLYIFFSGYGSTVYPIFNTSAFKAGDKVRVHHFRETIIVGVTVLDSDDKRFNFRKMGVGNELWTFYPGHMSAEPYKILGKEDHEEFLSIIKSKGELNARISKN